MKKRIISFVLMLSMAIAILSPARVSKVMAAENLSSWVIPDLVLGDTYGIYPLSWYDKDLTDSISKDQFRVLYYGLRRKLVETNAVKESRTVKPVIDNSITVKEAIDAFYTLLSNFDYPTDYGIIAGNDAVSFMMQVGVYTGIGGEQGLDELCSIEQAMVMASRIVMVFYELLEASSKGFLWEVKNGNNKVYLLGSIHLASTDLYPLSNKIWMAFLGSDALVVEANLYDQSDLLELQNLMFYTDGTGLKDHISEETYQKVVAAAALMGYPEELVSLIKPWALYLIFTNLSVLSTSAAEDATAQLGVDSNFLMNAILYEKPILAIEGLAKQGQIIDSFSAGLQEYLLDKYSTELSALIKDEADSKLDELDSSMEALYKSWREGDIEVFAKLNADAGLEDFEGELTDEVKEYAEEYNLKFLTQRDDAMAEYIINLLESENSGSYFVVLGALHYISDNDVIDRLEKAGYTVDQIK
jgi:hypothetical protein